MSDLPTPPPENEPPSTPPQQDLAPVPSAPPSAPPLPLDRGIHTPDVPNAYGPGSLFGGMALGCGANIAGLIAAGIVGGTLMGVNEILSLPFLAVPFGIGLAQLLWLYPLRRNMLRSGRTETAKGIVVMGAITLLLNAACWGTLIAVPLRFQ